MQINAEKIEDTRKCFLIKQWINKTKDNQGVTQSFLHWKVEHYSYQDLIDAYITQLNFMAEHTFMASWNYSQFKLAKKNLLPGQVLLVHDFAQNYLCLMQMSHRGCIGNISRLHCIPLWLIMYALMKVATKW